MTPLYLLQQMLQGLGLPASTAGQLRIHGHGALPSRYPVSDLACAAIGAAGLAMAYWISTQAPPAVELDRQLASWWFGYTLKPLGWVLPHVRSPVSDDYRTRDGWIRVHANATHHRARALQVLGLPQDASHDAVAERIMAWDAQTLEDALIGHGGCAAMLRTPDAWARHPQGMAVAQEPLIASAPSTVIHGASMKAFLVGRPLANVRVLDLTRVLAGPVATRFLAAHGAQVLRLDPPEWNEPGMVPEVTPGKRCALADLRTPEGCQRFVAALRQADVLIHGLRPGALDRLGFGRATRAALHPGLVDVSLDAWGWSGSWHDRRGFDSLVQMATGIAWPGDSTARPDPLPVQALDQATGYLMAACALRGITQRRTSGCGSRWRVSLARTAQLLTDAGTLTTSPEPALGAPPASAYAVTPEATAWGPALRLRPPCRIGAVHWAWSQGAVALRSSAVATFE